jgi:hypothetical protein
LYSNWLNPAAFLQVVGGAEGTRTHDPQFRSFGVIAILATNKPLLQTMGNIIFEAILISRVKIR